MKGFICLCFYAAIIFSPGCRKDHDKTVTSSIIGTWELTYQNAGWGGIHHYPPGNGHLLKFTPTDYEAYADGSLVKSGTYRIVADHTAGTSLCHEAPKGQYGYRIVYDGDENTGIFLQITRDTLSFVSGCFAVDGGLAKSYVRLGSE